MDVVIFNQQVPGSLTEEFVQNMIHLLDEYPDKIVILDSRHYGGRFKNIYRKTNEVEAAILNGLELETTDVLSLPDVQKYASNLYKESSKPVFITRGSRGLLVVDGTGNHIVSGIQLLKKIDTVGAGDTTLSALALCLGAGISAFEAAQFANFAAVVTVQKLFMTGTASPQEVLEAAKDPDYIYEPELAKDIRQAAYFNETEIEICSHPVPNFSNIRHAVFDHDGTISTLRQGWEQIMEPVMIKAILGKQYKTADETLYHRVVNRVREYIDKSTGIETLIQMAGLVEMVKEFGIIPADQILTKFEYKKIYNAALMEVVNQRTAKLQRSELNLEDFTIKGAVAFLKTLKSKGIKLYLASGTDNADVRNEANVLGYADLFDGGIYGALDDSDKYSKKMVIQRIIKENNLQGSQLVAFGDGPVELRESRKNSGFAIGIASNEVQRFGLNPEKRTRLIKAGANIIIPDFSQAAKLTGLLFNKQ
jgi:phosphoglycolate phosphatase-like HAD superfamily hydrolase